MSIYLNPTGGFNGYQDAADKCYDILKKECRIQILKDRESIKARLIDKIHIQLD